MKKMPDERKESVNLFIGKKGNNTDCSNYRGKSLSPTMYKILSNILFSRLTSNVEGITGHNQRGF
jgi:hypothetical protein